MSPVLTFICAGAALLVLIAGIGLLLGPAPTDREDPSERAGRRRPPRRRTARRRLHEARQARAMNAAQSEHLRALSDDADASR